MTTRDVSVVKRCLQRQYDVADEIRQAMLDRMCSIAISGAPETAVKAFGAVVKAQELDLKAMQVIINAKAVSLQDDVEEAIRPTVGPMDLREGIAALLAEEHSEPLPDVEPQVVDYEEDAA